ncbi:MAG TPA: hypothetical protein DCR46_08260 [Cytophagales bacterium]|jgi:hypothetical protein|nr:hypothetical protein [Cytophagales bacterium]
MKLEISTYEELRALIERECYNNDKTKYRVKVECKVASTTVDRIFGKKGEVHLSSLLDVCKFLGIKLYAERD